MLWFPFLPPRAQSVQWNPSSAPLTMAIVQLVTTVCAHVKGAGGGEDLVAVFAVEERGRPVRNTFQILHSLRDNFSTGLLRSYN